MFRLDKTRYALSERMAHGLAALCFIYLLLSGLALHTPLLYGLATFAGGPATMAWLHPLVGILYFTSMLVLFSAWGPAMRFRSADRRWLGYLHRYLYGRLLDLPATAPFHAGQKILFWTQTGAALILFLSGTVLWFPESFPVVLRGVGLFLHELGFILVAGAMLVHVYVSLFMVQGSLRGLLRGTVLDRWTKTSRSRRPLN